MNIKNYAIGILVCLGLAKPLNGIAQDAPSEKMVIGTFSLKPSTDDADHNEEAVTLSGIVTEVLNRNPNFTVIARNIDDLISKERATQTTGDYIMGQIAEQGKAMGAKQMLTGTLNSINIQAKENTGSTPGRIGSLGNLAPGNTAANVSFTLNLVDVGTGKAIQTKTFSAKGSGMGTGGGARADALKAMNKAAKRQIANWVVTFFDFKFTIAQIEEMDKKGVPKTVLITGGKEMELEKGEDLDVNEVQMLMGEARILKVCELNVKEVQGAFTLCQVKKGAKELKEKMDAKAELKIQFQPEKD